MCIVELRRVFVCVCQNLYFSSFELHGIRHLWIHATCDTKQKTQRALAAVSAQLLFEKFRFCLVANSLSVKCKLCLKCTLVSFNRRAESFDFNPQKMSSISILIEMKYSVCCRPSGCVLSDFI